MWGGVCSSHKESCKFIKKLLISIVVLFIFVLFLIVDQCLDYICAFLGHFSLQDLFGSFLAQLSCDSSEDSWDFFYVSDSAGKPMFEGELSKD